MTLKNVHISCLLIETLEAAERTDSLYRVQSCLSSLEHLSPPRAEGWRFKLQESWLLRQWRGVRRGGCNDGAGINGCFEGDWTCSIITPLLSSTTDSECPLIAPKRAPVEVSARLGVTLLDLPIRRSPALPPKASMVPWRPEDGARIRSPSSRAYLGYPVEIDTPR